jgi:hypothetical protein
MAETKEELKVRLFFDRILTTYNKAGKSKGGIYLDAPAEYQTVVACGPNSNVNVGDVIAINYQLFPSKKEYPKNGIGQDKEITILPLEEIDGEEYLLLSSREVKWIKTK